MCRNEASKRVKFVPKGWGFEKIIVNNTLYCGKLLYVIKDMRGSIHYHKIKNESFYVHSGHVEVRYYDDREALEAFLNQNGPNKVYDLMEKIILGPGDVFPVPVGRVHQLIGLQDSEVFEFSTEDFSDDSYRLIKGD